jgi:hypothetical protein
MKKLLVVAALVIGFALSFGTVKPGQHPWPHCKPGVCEPPCYCK